MWQHKAATFIQRARPRSFCKAEASCGPEAEDLTPGGGTWAAQSSTGDSPGVWPASGAVGDDRSQVCGLALGLLHELNSGAGLFSLW